MRMINLTRRYFILNFRCNGSGSERAGGGGVRHIAMAESGRAGRGETPNSFVRRLAIVSQSMIVVTRSATVVTWGARVPGANLEARRGG